MHLTKFSEYAGSFVGNPQFKFGGIHAEGSEFRLRGFNHITYTLL